MSEAASPSWASSGAAWERPTIVPLPATTTDVENPVVLLNGTWKLNTSPPDEFWSDAVDSDNWPDAEVPGFTLTQGFDVEDGEEYAYRRRIRIPADFAGKRVYLRFEGVSCEARLWVNGQFVRRHYGGFTSWDCDITALVTPGQDAWLTLGVADRRREVSPFHFGGIIRDVKLFAVPTQHLTRLQVATDLDSACKDATLRVTAAMAFHGGQNARVRLALRDPSGNSVRLEPDRLDLSSDRAEATVDIPVASPWKWDAEHPMLYTLEASVLVEGGIAETVVKAVGFRKVGVRGNRLYVNDREVKLRGVNRHDIHPKTGRAITPEVVKEDVRLLKAANVNFVRTSHYPPREDFLDECDREGIYVEDEIAVAFVYQSIRPTQNDPEFTPAYLGQWAEMIERDRSHACVIMWSLANESFWGRNFQAEYDYARREDPARPLIFSYPITMPEGAPTCDIWSLHYGSWDFPAAAQTDNFSAGKARGPGAPVLHDEYAHLPCYDLPEQMRDPAVREFWGESIKRFWENIFTTDGALGGAIWAYIDDSMITPGGYTGPWEWGLIDGWRREKPEHWLTKKAYSPVRIDDRPVVNPGPGSPLRIPIANWHDHTNLGELEVHWAAGRQYGTVSGPDVEPHAEGVLEIPARNWQDGEVLRLRFADARGLLVDEYNLPVGGITRSFPAVAGPTPRISEDGRSIRISGSDFDVVFDRRTGLISRAIYRGVEVIKGGPYLNLVGVSLPEWTLGDLAVRAEGDEAVVDLRGSHGPVDVRYEIRIDGKGLLTTSYTIEKPPIRPPRARRLRVGMDVGGYREVGVSFILPSGVDRLSWERQGLWSAYPEGHLGRLSGVARRIRPGQPDAYGERPDRPWAEDSREYALFGRYDVGGRGTRDFRSSKHNIWRASALIADSTIGVRVESDGTQAIRMEVLDDPRTKLDDRDSSVRYVGTWVRVDGEAGSYLGTEMLSNKAGDYAELGFDGTGICWIGAKDMIFGRADVYVDGVKVASGIDLYSGLGHGASRGEEKLHRRVLFSQEGLAPGRHTIRVAVTGERDVRSSNSFVSVDAFEVLGVDSEADVRLVVNDAWNYPELTWGNYVKEPVLVEEGYSGRVRLRLTDAEGTA